MTDAPDLEPAALEAAISKALHIGQSYVLDAMRNDGGIENCEIGYRKDFEAIRDAIAALAARSAPEAGKAVTDAMVKRATQEFLSHRGERPERIKRGGYELWEENAPAMRAALTAALASSPAPTGAEPVAWMVLRKDNLHLPVLTSREDADKYQLLNPEETLQPLYAYPQPVAPTGKTAGLVERLNERAASYRLGGPSSEHTASMLDEAAAALTASEAEAADLRRKLEEARKALEPFGRNAGASSLARVYAHLTREHAQIARRAAAPLPEDTHHGR